jgi:carbohydrate kinase (thermoresistant glucokinase family)
MKIGPTGDFSMVIVIMGVTGCGKTNVGRRVAEVLRVPFLDADDFHPASNIRKMKKGIALKDDDRGPWLKTVAEKMAEMAGQGGVW